MNSRTSLPRPDWRWLIGSPLLLSTWCAFGVGLFALFEVAATLRRAEQVRVEVAFELARLAAEAAAIEVGVHESGERAVQIGEFEVHMVSVGERMSLTTRGRDGERLHWECARLGGAASAAFERRLTVVDESISARMGEGVVVRRAELPRLDPEILAGGQRAEVTLGFRADSSLSLLQWDGGTEGEDFVFDRFGGDGWVPPPGGVLVVPGHLWLAPHVDEYRWHLESDLLVVVEGNLYMGASARVTGPGRLVFATRPGKGARPFADRDGNGRWSVGDEERGGPFGGVIEGGGNVYLGLPGTRRSLHLAAAIVAGGEVHLVTDTVCDGALVLPYGLTELSRGLRLGLTGERLFDAQREAVPGFLATGSPRPGFLRRVANNALVAGSAGAFRDRIQEGQQPLYLASPAR